MGNLFAELKRRHIYRVAAAYAVVAWVLIQLVNNIAPMLKLPDWVGTVVLVLLAVGFPIAILFAWIQKLGSDESAAARPATGKLDWTLIGALAVVIALVSYQQLAPTTGARTAPLQPGGISIAVLPFANLSGDTAQEFFSDGMTEEINSALAKVPDLIVIGRTSAFQFTGRGGDLRAIGQALGASHLIEGSVRKAGNRVRITAQLVRADSGVQLWSENYDREVNDIFAIQEDIAQSIAGALRVPLGLQQGDTLVRDRTTDLESYQQYLRARALYRARGPGIAQAIAILEPLVVRDPKFAPAWAALAFGYILEIGAGGQGPRGVSSLDKATRAAQEAIRLDSRNALAHSVLATVQTSGGKWAAAEDLYRQALALDPNDTDVLHRYSLSLAVTGRLKEALSLREKLRTLEPFVPVYNIFTAIIMEQNRQYQAAISILEGLPADAAAGSFPGIILAGAYAAEGHYDKAADALLAIKGDEVSRQSIEDAARLLRTGPQTVKSPEALPQLGADLVFVYSYLGATDRILDAVVPDSDQSFIASGALNRGTLHRLWDPEYAQVRKTERFKALMRNSGLVDYWRARGWPDLCRPMGADDFVCD